jgi:predicted nucleic acid-binding protein
LQDYADLPWNRYPHTILAGRIWELRHNWTAHDAAYIALAEELPAPLLARDRTLSSAAGCRAKVIVV